ncbi:hypothetical protein ACLOJK_038734 [Asimina triloba]
MTSTKVMHFLRPFDEFKVLKLPYQQGQDKKRLSMYFILPHKKDGLPNLIEKFNIDSSFLDHYLNLNEEGTEAAAATAAFVAYNCAGWRPTPINFIADRSFMFMIREETSGAVLFIGNVVDPSKSG